MICTLFDPDFPELVQGGDELIERWSENPETKLWVHFDGTMGEADLDLLREKFGIHPLALQDANRDRHPPKLERFEDHTFLLFKPLSRDSKDSDCSMIQMAMFVSKRFLITRTSGPSRSIEKLTKELQADLSRFQVGPESLVARIIRLFIDRFLGILLQLEPKLELIEDELLTRTDDAVLAELTGYKSDLKKLRRIFIYHEQILGDLRKEVFPGFTEGLQHELNDVFEQQERAGSLTQLYYELSSDLIDGYLSLSSHRLNQIMKVLTIVTAIFVPLGFLAGLYGMNFEHIPELHYKSGYFILLGVMASIATVLMIIFRRKRWL